MSVSIPQEAVASMVTPELGVHLLHIAWHGIEQGVADFRSERDRKANLAAQEAARKRAMELEVSDDPLDLKTAEAKSAFVKHAAEAVDSLTDLAGTLLTDSTVAILRCPVCGKAARFDSSPMKCLGGDHSLVVSTCPRCQEIMVHAGLLSACVVCGFRLSSLSFANQLLGSHAMSFRRIDPPDLRHTIETSITRLRILELRYGSSSMSGRAQ
jgi:hypothetical protein